MQPTEILDTLDMMFPDAKCELNHRNTYELTIAVVLSAQTTDVSVNLATPSLFAAYPDVASLANASYEDICTHIKRLGLYRNKARSIQALAKVVSEKYNGEIPHTMKDLTSLPGVGRKCANVILAECFQVPSLAVDTHVNRISKRLGLAKKDDSLEDVERKLKRKFPRERWIKAHHEMIFFGRYLCHSRNPECEKCPFQSICRYLKHKAA